MKTNRFDYIKYDNETLEKQKEFKEKFQELEKMIDQLKNGRSKSLIYTSLEESYMWVGKALRDQQITKDLQEERSNS